MPTNSNIKLGLGIGIPVILIIIAIIMAGVHMVAKRRKKMRKSEQANWFTNVVFSNDENHATENVYVGEAEASDKDMTKFGKEQPDDWHGKEIFDRKPVEDGTELCLETNIYDIIIETEDGAVGAIENPKASALETITASIMKSGEPTKPKPERKLANESSDAKNVMFQHSNPMFKVNDILELNDDLAISDDCTEA